jgi:hypothetical protein
MKLVKENDFVRLLEYPEDDKNAYARVNLISQDTNQIHIVNFNMPFSGTISKTLTREEFERLTNRTF